MPYYDVANLVTVTKSNMVDEMPCGYGTLRTTGVRIWHQVSRRPAQRSPQLQNLNILIVKSCSILNAPPSLQVLSGVRENALAQSENILQSSRGGWEDLEVLSKHRRGLPECLRGLRIASGPNYTSLMQQSNRQQLKANGLTLQCIFHYFSNLRD
jgi:hypothetical protein